jgi:hypothetical protein
MWVNIDGKDMEWFMVMGVIFGLFFFLYGLIIFLGDGAFLNGLGRGWFIGWRVNFIKSFYKHLYWV